MSLLDLVHQVTNRLPIRFGGTGNAYGWGQGVVIPYRNMSGSSIPLGTIVSRQGPAGTCAPDLVEDSTEVIGVVVGYFSYDGSFNNDDAPVDGYAAVMVKGRCRVLMGSADADAGDYLYVSGDADGTAKGDSAMAAGAFGQFEADGNDTEVAYVSLFGAPVFGAGGGSSPLTTKGDIYGYDTADARIPVGSNGQLLTADSSDAQGVVWATKTSKWQCTATFFSVGASDQIWIRVPYDCTVTGWDITANASGAAVVDVWMDTYANFPPTVADTIAGSEKPTLSAARKNQDTSLSTWTTALVEGRYLMFNVDSTSGLATVQVVLYGTRDL